MRFFDEYDKVMTMNMNCIFLLNKRQRNPLLFFGSLCYNKLLSDRMGERTWGRQKTGGRKILLQAAML